MHYKLIYENQFNTQFVLLSNDSSKVFFEDVKFNHDYIIL